MEHFILNKVLKTGFHSKSYRASQKATGLKARRISYYLNKDGHYEDNTFIIISNVQFIKCKRKLHKSG
jgi:hypothetical protein